MAKHRAGYQLPITIGWIAATLFGIKVLWFAQGDMPTAVEIVRHLDFLPTISAMAITLVPVLILPVAAYFTIKLRQSQLDEDTSRIVKMVWSLLLTLSIMFSALVPVIVAAAMWLAHSVHKFAQKKDWNRKFEVLKFDFEMVQPGVSGLLVIALLSGPPWLAKQELTLAGERQLVYLLSEEENVVTVVDAASKTVERVESSRIDHRRLCASEFTAFTTPVLAWASGPSYTSC